MKRFVLLLSALCLLTIWGFQQKAMEPARFTGIWYNARENASYAFREGIIQRLQTEDPEQIYGAYTFTSDSITLFVTDMEGLQEVTTLYWVSRKDADVLCQTRDGSGIIYFSRAQMQK